MAEMKWKSLIALLIFALVTYAIGALFLGSLGMDIHWRGFR
jgi:hypothetical protein